VDGVAVSGRNIHNNARRIEHIRPYSVMVHWCWLVAWPKIVTMNSIVKRIIQKAASVGGRMAAEQIKPQ